MTVQDFLVQFTHSPNVKTVYINSAIWDQIPLRLIDELKSRIAKRKDFWDWIGTMKQDELDMQFADAFHNKSKRIIFLGPWGEVEFKRK